MPKIENLPEKMKKYGPLVLIALILIAAVWVLIHAKSNGKGLTASGTIESVQIKIAPQLGGQVLDVLVDEGEAVKVGELLVKLDQAQLQAQIAQAQAALHQAQASYDLLVTGGTPEQRASRIAAAELQLLSAEQDLQDLYDNAAQMSADAQKKLALARDALDDAQHDWTNNQPGNRASPEELKSAKAKVTLAEYKMEKRQRQYDHAGDKLEKARAQIALTQAIDNYQTAVWYLNWLKDGADEIEMANLDADVALAQANLAIAEDDYEAVKSGPDPDQLAIAEAAVTNAQAQLDLAKADPGQEELEIGQARVDAAQASLELLQVQLAMTELTAPADATILYRLIEPGELAVPGSPVLILIQLDALSLTVYLPEDQYGKVSLGDQVPLRVDSFPDQVFTAEVVRIADQAEYTPRNVQTQEGRRTTVFGVELKVTDTAGVLKPGMPADVFFESLGVEG
jgi:HlyD family secretion protein